MLKLRKVAITGGLSCGKSTVCRFFKHLGAYVVSADEIVHQLLSPNTDLGQKVIDLLGSDVLNDQHFDRAKIANKVFLDKELLRSYENLLHPAVRDEVERQYQRVCKDPYTKLFIVEIPLLFETGSDNQYDATIAVIADPEICRQRLKEAKGHEAQEYDRRMARQISPKLKAEKATYVIENNGSLDNLEQAVKKIYQQLTI